MAFTDVDTTLAKLRLHLDEQVTLKLLPVTAGALVRRHVRALLADATDQGVKVRNREAKGLMESTFFVEMSGTGRQVYATMQALSQLA